MDKKELEENVLLIKKMMEESTQKTLENGYYFISFSLWAIFGTIIPYLMAYLGFERFISLFWVIYWPLISFFIVIIGNKKRKNRKIKSNSILGLLTGLVWFSLLVLMFIIISSFYLVTNTFNCSFPFSILSFCLSFGFFFNGFTVKNGIILKVMALLWLLAGLSLLLIKNQIIIPLIFSLYQILFQLLPGFFYFKKIKKSIEL